MPSERITVLDMIRYIQSKKFKLYIFCVLIAISAIISGCVDNSKPQKYVNENDKSNILILNPDHTAISSDHGANFAGKYRQDDNKITVTWDFMGLVEFYTMDKVNQTLSGPEPKKDTWTKS